MTARLVARLDAMPLAIELEALGLPQLLERLHLQSGGIAGRLPGSSR
jgi:hypothetical protein